MAAAWTARHHPGAAIGLRAFEETVAASSTTASVDAAGIPGTVGPTHSGAGGVCGGVGVRRRQDARRHERHVP